MANEEKKGLKVRKRRRIKSMRCRIHQERENRLRN